MVLNQEEPQESIQFYDNPAGYLFCNQCEGYYELQDDEKPEDFETCSCGNTLEYIPILTELENPDLKSSENISHKVSVINQITSQSHFTDETFTHTHQDKWDLWDNSNKPSKEYNNQNLVADDVIEMNRLMMMVDQKRALEESKPSKVKSLSKKVGLIGFLGAAIVLLIIVLSLTILGEMI